MLARCIGAVSRCNNGPKISLELHGPWYHLLRQLQTVPLPDVRSVTMYLGQHDLDPAIGQRNPYMHLDPGFELWDLCFEGSSFPDLDEVSINTLHVSPENIPATLNEGASMAIDRPRAAHAHRDPTSFSPFHGLRNMTTIKLRYNDYLNTNALYSLFGSNIIPHKLKRLEIVNCPALNSVANLESLSTLLERSLQLLDHLQLHLQRTIDTINDDHSDIRIRHLIHDHVRLWLGEEPMRDLTVLYSFDCNSATVAPTRHCTDTAHSAQGPSTKPDSLVACWTEIFHN